MLIGFGKDWRSKLVLLILTRQLKNGGGGGGGVGAYCGWERGMIR